MEKHIYKDILFVVLERHMIDNYTYFDSRLTALGLNYHVVYLPEVPTQMSIFQRVQKGKLYFRILKDFLKKKYPEGIKSHLVIYSNSEGFIFTNKKKWMPKLIGCKEVVLQHGLMPLSLPHPILRKIIDFFSERILGMSILGKGFGGTKTDAIVVWGEQFRDYLIKTMHWNEKSVYVSGRMLKPMISPMNTFKNTCTALFLLQDYAAINKMSNDKQNSIFIEIAQLLAEKYDKLIIRKHPKMSPKIYSIFQNIKNASCSEGSLFEDLKKTDRVYSFTSSALIDASLMNKQVVAISLPIIPESNFGIFQRVVKVEDLKSYLEKYRFDDPYATIKTSFFMKEDNVEKVLNELIKC